MSGKRFVDAEVWPEGSLEVLSQFEVDQLQSSGAGGLYPLLRRCMLAVLQCGQRSMMPVSCSKAYKDFEVGFIQQDRGLKLTLTDAPAEAFVDGKMIRGTRELLFAVLRDIVFTRNEIVEAVVSTWLRPDGITNAVFHIVRNASLLTSRRASTWSFAGAATRSAARNTIIRKRSATNWACVA